MPSHRGRGSPQGTPWDLQGLWGSYGNQQGPPRISREPPGTCSGPVRISCGHLGSPGNLQTTPEVPCGSLENLWGSPGIWWGLPSPLRGRWSHRCLAGPVPWDLCSCPQGCHPRDRTRLRGQRDPQGDTEGYLVCGGLRSVQGAVGPTQPPSVLRGFFWAGASPRLGKEAQRGQSSNGTHGTFPPSCTQSPQSQHPPGQKDTEMGSPRPKYCSKAMVFPPQPW